MATRSHRTLLGEATRYGGVYIESWTGDPTDQADSLEGSIVMSTAGDEIYYSKFGTGDGWCTFGGACTPDVTVHLYEDWHDLVHTGVGSWSDGDIVVCTTLGLMFRYFTAVQEAYGLFPMEPLGLGRGIIQSVTRLDGIDLAQDYAAAGWSITSPGATFTYMSGVGTYVSSTSQSTEINSGYLLTSADTKLGLIVDPVTWGTTVSGASLWAPLVRTYVSDDEVQVPGVRFIGGNRWAVNMQHLTGGASPAWAAANYTNTEHQGMRRSNVANHGPVSTQWICASSTGEGQFASSDGLVEKNNGIGALYNLGAGVTLTTPAVSIRMPETVTTVGVSYGKIGLYRMTMTP